MNKKSKNRFFDYFFRPHYDELTLFSMAYVLLLMILVNHPPWELALDTITINREAIVFLVIFFPLPVGMALCLWHAFSERRKTLLEKKTMLLFAVILNGFSGIWCGTYIIVHSDAWALTFFPVWNIVNGFILLSLLRESAIGEECIEDKDVSLNRLISGTVMVTVLFLLCHFLYEQVWAVTLSICTAWTTNLNKMADNLIERVKLGGFRV